jgi:RNA polymerase sigma-70 factor (ECF subfamily)
MERGRLALLDHTDATGEPEIDETWRLLASLSSEQYVVLVLRYYEDLSHQDIARIIGRPPATVRTRVRRGLRALRKELDK